MYASVCVVGLMSVFAQQIEYLSSALRVLDSSNDNQYGIRGQPRFDKVLSVPSEGGGTGVVFDHTVYRTCTCWHFMARGCDCNGFVSYKCTLCVIPVCYNCSPCTSI